MSEPQLNPTTTPTPATTIIENVESAQFDWVTHWQTLGQPWRTEVEIDPERQQFLSQRLAITVDVVAGRYPFKNVELNRADVEWLLATHEDGQGPVDWNDLSQRNRLGLDLRGADLRNQNLQGLPLTRLQAGIYWTEGSRRLTRAQIHAASIHLDEADLRSCQLQGAKLYHAYLQNAILGEAQVQEAQLNEANLQNTILLRCNFERANLEDAHFEGAFLYQARLGGANMVGTFFSAACELDEVSLRDENNNYPILVDTNWGDAVLAVLDFESLLTTGDEQNIMTLEIWTK
ncbi:MAG TPA: pentapeptide repeat-containing protein [Chloroflexia bacterium]|nr:pentapeptide repeat-containing protein [Chloroflexia bacterium]